MTSNNSWFSCCNADAVEYDKWQDINPHARNAVQNEIGMITGNIKNNNKIKSHTEGFDPKVLLKNSSPSTTGSIDNVKNSIGSINAVNDSIIYSKFDDLISESSFIKPLQNGQKQIVVNGKNNIRHEVPVMTIPQNAFQQINHYQPQVFYHQGVQQMQPAANYYIRR